MMSITLLTGGYITVKLSHCSHQPPSPPLPPLPPPLLPPLPPPLLPPLPSSSSKSGTRSPSDNKRNQIIIVPYTYSKFGWLLA